MSSPERSKRKYAQLKARMAADPEYARQYRERVLRQQRVRYQNPEVRRRHALACATWRDRKAAGILGRKTQAPHKKVEMPKFRNAPFQIRFDD
tara:strand:- start:250 stop:528 length:279 start_codon:yes stop_codon:yes gene_type:complete